MTYGRASRLKGHRDTLWADRCEGLSGTHQSDGTTILYGPVVDQAGAAGQAIATIPEILWELSVGIYLFVKGFKPSPLSGRVTEAALRRKVG